MPDYDHAAAPALPIKFSDGTEYRLSPLSDRDIRELDEWVRSELVKIARDSMRGQDLTQQERDETMRIALQEAQCATWLSGRGARMFGTVTGMARLVWQMARREHPAVTEAELYRHLYSPANLDVANDAFARLNRVPSQDGAVADPKKKSRARARSTARSRDSSSTRRTR